MGQPFTQARTVTIGASLTGSAAISVPYGQTWRVTRLSTQGDSTTTPELRVFRGLTGTLVGTSGYANADTSEEQTLTLQAGETLTATWSKASAGARMTFTMEGELL